eukprot:CAMPEP_0203830942 /NCGR_PEP_ID=MMETSP0115-20131106/67136_1 /ASSEMBLY_ACC=CAM_ASM_000227 /TAXON_ID=33651 /ORGANISM="Bicosoecid sp, Strain ms1" /LENGTH=51 /DNA_ID=CAMNT_0050740005 /DNA_START=166 /DNA_END=318 /DNA_ORIENTATION=-
MLRRRCDVSDGESSDDESSGAAAAAYAHGYARPAAYFPASPAGGDATSTAG